MLIFGVAKRILKKIISQIRDYQTLVLLEKKYPNCEFYSGAKVSSSTFENFNVINTGVIIDSSSMGSHTYVQKHSTIFNAQIGRFCSIAAGVSIGPGIHSLTGISSHPAFYLKNTPLVKTFSKNDIYESSKRTFIGNDVWIGERAIILDGIKIGNGAIIAANAVVVKDVEPYAIVGGIPAKFIKNRFDSGMVQKLEVFKWWDKDDAWLEKNHLVLENESNFLNFFNNL